MKVNSSLNISNTADCNNLPRSQFSLVISYRIFFETGGRKKENIPQSKLRVQRVWSLTL